LKILTLPINLAVCTGNLFC